VQLRKIVSIAESIFTDSGSFSLDFLRKKGLAQNLLLEQRRCSLFEFGLFCWSQLEVFAN